MLQNPSTSAYILIVFLVAFTRYGYADNFYQFAPLAYFEQQQKKSKPSSLQGMDWREPVTTATGQQVLYQPPKPVLDLLNDPSINNAKAYIQWQKDKMARIEKAQEVIVSLQKDLQ